MSRVPIESQRVDAPLTQSATFLVVTLCDGDGAAQTVRATLASVADLSKNVAIRDLSANFACTVGIGAACWDRVMGGRPRPAELHSFKEFRGAKHTAPATPGDLLFHIRSERRDLCFEFEKQLLDKLGDAVKVQDATVGFRYFDLRDLLGFVDGTANPVGAEVQQAVLISDDGIAPTADADTGAQALDQARKAAQLSLGGSYVVVQKYVHDMAAWRRLAAEQQEAIIGRTKLDNVELDDAAPGMQCSHKTLATIEGNNGDEQAILRDNMPFGEPAKGEFGTYFIGYCARLWVVEKMLERMYVGEPEGLHDRLLDYSTPLTGCTFFVPSASLLAQLEDA